MGRVGVRLGRLRCKAKFLQEYGIGIVCLGEGGCHRQKRDSQSVESEPCYEAVGQTLYLVLDFYFLVSVLTNYNEGKGSLGSALFPMHVHGIATCCLLSGTSSEILLPVELFVWHLG